MERKNRKQLTFSSHSFIKEYWNTRKFDGGRVMKMKTILAAAALLLLFSAVHAVKSEYVGAKKCRVCHTGAKNGNVYENWEKAVHARALETLKAKGEEKNPRCLGCHTTGFNAGGYTLGAPNARDFEGVQCEECHGPGSRYKDTGHMKDTLAAVENGLMLPVESLCIKCHNKKSPTFKGFNYENAVKKITHVYRKSS